MNFNNYTIKSQEAVQKAVSLVREHGQQAIEPTHLLLGVLASGQNVTTFLFQKLGVSIAPLTAKLEKQLDGFSRVSGGEPHLSREANSALQKAEDFARKLGDQYVSIEHLLLGIVATSSVASQALKDAGVTEKELLVAINELRKGEKVTSQSAEDTYQSLEKFAINLTKRATRENSTP